MKLDFVCGDEIAVTTFLLDRRRNGVINGNLQDWSV
jgi:hypothetical protein